jgi:diguanylate cyclase (GGDEF)-like protein
MNRMTRLSAGECDPLPEAFELVREPVFLIDALRGRILDVNEAACDALAIARKRLIGRPWILAQGCLGSARLCDVDRDRFIAVVDLPQPSSRHSAPRDALTGLPTREAVAGVDGVKQVPLPIGVLFVDLDGFKHVNDTLGHLAGDHVLRVVAQRLSDTVRSRDLVVRYGGDEFLVVVRAASGGRDLARLARRVGRGLRRPIRLHGHEVIVSASIGFARRKSSRQSLHSLIAEADSAMYRVKGSGRC